MRFVIVTGMSGAGKGTTLKMLEDMGYFCVDNLPLSLVGRFAELVAAETGEVEKAALGLDIRSGVNPERIKQVFAELRAADYPVEVLFLDASNSVLLKRYKETRRMHPLAGEGRIAEGIAKERETLTELRKEADYILDTSTLLTRELKQQLEKIFVENKEFKSLMLTVLSFGFKFGIPGDADMVLDVRFLPNPYYLAELKRLSGNDKPVQDYVLQFPAAHEFLDKLEDMIRFLLPHYTQEGKNQLVIAIGCTGGKHRSVTLANQLYERLSSNPEYGVKLDHRDIQKDAVIKGE